MNDFIVVVWLQEKLFQFSNIYLIIAVKHGGKIVELRKAQFIFSQDPESFDTKR